MKTLLLIVAIILILWTLWSIYTSRAEQMRYRVVEKHGDYEIRIYEPYVVAEVQVPTTGRSGMNDGFRILANYIFGANQKDTQIAMTAPVMAEEKEFSDLGGSGEKIAMTAPVMMQEENSGLVMRFSMPHVYSLESIPKPEDSRITLKQIPEKKIAAYRFGWYFRESQTQNKKQEFIAQLQKDHIHILGKPVYAGYNGPGTIPFLVKNEILVEIQ